MYNTRSLWLAYNIAVPFSSGDSANVCALERDGGGCDEYHIKWYYDSLRSRCGRFIYTGCDGNANRFETQDECETRCVTAETGKQTFSLFL